MSTIKNNLSAILGKRLIKISEVSDATGISRTTLTNLYYRRSSGITFEVLDKLCKYLNCDVGELFECKEVG
jgi:putative transcriptional regulator|nr:MAG TPA: Cro/C1-type HTH DNA-binding domain protein [Bacteriophage sp.]